MQLALLGFVLPNQVGNAVLGELVGDVPGECFAVHYLLIQLSAFFAHETLPIRERRERKLVSLPPAPGVIVGDL
jgi:hypothetical protein